MKVTPILEVKRSLLSKFDCGEEALNIYIKQFARKNDRLGIGRTYLLLDNDKVLGYYTISMAQIEFDSLPESSSGGLPKYPLPAVRIGRLAVSANEQGKGLGEYLLMDALTRSKRVSNEIAVYSVVVDAKNEKARDFYLKYGFISFKEDHLSLFLTVSTINKL